VRTHKRDPGEIRQDIEQSRCEVGDTAAALAEKADVKAQARNEVDEIKRRFEDKRSELVRRATDATPESAGQVASTIGNTARENPTPFAVAGAAIGGFLLGRLIARR
jgi:hypothetical protein